jgi:hypothetical protein
MLMAEVLLVLLTAHLLEELLVLLTAHKKKVLLDYS